MRAATLSTMDAAIKMMTQMLIERPSASYPYRPCMKLASHDLNPPIVPSISHVRFFVRQVILPVRLGLPAKS